MESRGCLKQMQPPAHLSREPTQLHPVRERLAHGAMQATGRFQVDTVCLSWLSAGRISQVTTQRRPKEHSL